MKKTKIDLIKLDSTKGQPIASSVREEEKKSPAETISGKPKIKLTKKFILIIGTIGFVFLVGAIGTAGYLGFVSIPGISPKKKPESNKMKQVEIGPTIKLSPLVVNLKEESGRHYLKTTIVLEIGKKDWVEKIQSRMSSLTDMAILTLSDKRLEDLRPPESREQLKQELLVKMNQHLNPHKINRIYFDEFLFQ